MKIRALALGSIAALGMLVGFGAPTGVTYGANYQNRSEFTGGSAQPAGWRRLARRYWDGKNRTPGDRAHKRMKHRRAASHHNG